MGYSLEDINYVEELFERFYSIGAIETGGVTRLGYSETEDLMHKTFFKSAEELGFTSSVDQVGNGFISNGDFDEYYLIGSHLDSVVDGGRYDGVAGVLAGLLVMKWAKEDNLKIPLKTVAFRCEESSNFGVSTMGSELITSGNGSDFAALTGKDGRTLGEIFKEKGYSFKPEIIKGVKKYLEVHIEQARVLEKHGEKIGIVTTIAGPRRFKYHITGKSEHSGATPMNIRKDALCGAAEIILEIEKIGLEESVLHSVATTGVVKNMPNALNVVPGEVELQVDTRGIDMESLNRMENHIYEEGKSICRRRGLQFIRERLGGSDPVEMDSKMQDKLEGVIEELGYPYRRMVSGAGHDAMKMTRICDTALLFIPCKDGISHNKNEFTDIASICDGASVIYEYLKGDFNLREGED
ncbi:M20 family metallo-hydrolase [Anaerosphaera multitolerans]|uniref:Zn-dependent hydrolase n=1 Tax=Anaerosphaera multitolerans TaxID=2487351 RepID=A0A437S5L8_9FIRM|nr:M20 family metallo-hydrolase [Anaerosphaera multitolerans]RVU54294.1 Zn-dependent hydrolase [Anaerosphaera multitolerans]